MNIYELRCGSLLYYVAANDEEHATEQGQDASRFPDMHFLPFTVKMIEVEGYVITAEPIFIEEAPKRRKRGGE